MGILTTSEQDGNLNFVIVREKANGFFDFEADIVFAGFGSNANFFEPRLMRLVFRLTFLFVVIEFAEIHDSANRRLRIASHFNQIEASFLCLVERFLSWNDA